METPKPITAAAYIHLRHEARQALAKLGIPNNPGFSDYNVISSMRSAVNMPDIEPWNEMDYDEPTKFKDELAACLGLEEPFTVGDIALGLKRLHNQE